MAIDFPADPIVDQEYYTNNTLYVYDGSKWSVKLTARALTVTSDSLPVDPVVGQFWWNSDVASMFVYTGAEWVPAVASAGVTASGLSGISYMHIDESGDSVWANSLNIPHIIQPVLSTSVSALSIDSTQSFNMTTGAFEVLYLDNTADTHDSTDWLIRTADRATVLFSDLVSSNLTSVTVPANTLASGEEYYAYARHNGQNFEGIWSVLKLATI
jgi:hypothetical protein